MKRQIKTVSHFGCLNFFQILITENIKIMEGCSLLIKSDIFSCLEKI